MSIPDPKNKQNEYTFPGDCRLGYHIFIKRNLVFCPLLPLAISKTDGKQTKKTVFLTLKNNTTRRMFNMGLKERGYAKYIYYV